MPLRTLAHAALISVSFALPGLAAEQTVPLGASPTLGGGKFTMGGGITVAVEPRRAIDGQLALCGVWAESERLSAYVRPHVRELLAPATLAVDGRVVHHDLRIFTQVAPAETYAGAPATCIGTGMAYRSDPLVEIRIPRKSITRERDRAGVSAGIMFMPETGQNLALTSGSILPAKWTRFSSQRLPN